MALSEQSTQVMNRIALLNYVTLMRMILDQHLKGQEQDFYLISISSSHSTKLAQDVHTGLSWSSFPASPVM